MTQHKKRMTLRLPSWLDSKIEQRAKEEMVSKNAVIVRACRRLVEEYEAKELR